MRPQKLAYELRRLLSICELTRKEVLRDMALDHKAQAWRNDTFEVREKAAKDAGGWESPIADAAAGAFLAWAGIVDTELRAYDENPRRDDGLELTRLGAWVLVCRILQHLEEVDELT